MSDDNMKRRNRKVDHKMKRSSFEVFDLARAPPVDVAMMSKCHL